MLTSIELAKRSLAVSVALSCLCPVDFLVEIDPLGKLGLPVIELTGDECRSLACASVYSYSQIRSVFRVKEV